MASERKLMVWCVVSPFSGVLPYTACRLRRESIRTFQENMSVHNRLEWGVLYKDGYRCGKFRMEEVQ